MQIHQATHARAGDGDFIRPYHCNVRGCWKAFTEKRNLNAHRRTAHTEVRRATQNEGGGEGRAIHRIFDSTLLVGCVSTDAARSC